MTTVKAFGSIRLHIWPNDHEPPHFHLLGIDGYQGRFRIEDGTCLEERGRRPRTVGEALEWAAENREHLALAWVRITGKED